MARSRKKKTGSVDTSSGTFGLVVRIHRERKGHTQGSTIMNSMTNLSAAHWRKSSYSGSDGGDCIEAALGFISGSVPVRDSKDPQGPALVFSNEAWSSFLTAVKTAELPTV